MKGKLDWGVLLHLGSNMWDDYLDDPDSPEIAVGPNGKPSRYRPFVRCEDACWTRCVDQVASDGLNMVFIDLGEALAYPSHPELAVKGTWSVEKMRAELRRIRALGLEPVPKLNFSACHDAWLKEYHRMLSTPEYYGVVSDVIGDVCEIFDHPRLFHIGYDEEMAIAQHNTFATVLRQGDLWWHDLNFTIKAVSGHGARPVMWADAMWTGREEYLRRMSRDVLQMNWYYRSDFSPRKLVWNSDWEKKGGWGETVQGAAAFLELEKAGFDQMPCTSNWAEDASADAVVSFCRDRIDPDRLKGFCMASWARPCADEGGRKNVSKVQEGTALLAAAKERVFGR